MADTTSGADKSLDDFFAKRDKKKKKEKTKGKDQAIVPGPTVLKKGKKEKEKSTKNDSQDTQLEKEDEEWKEFEQKEVDYTGLRVQALLLSDEKEEEEYDKKEEIGEDGEMVMVSGGDKTSGPWNKSAPPPTVSVPVEVEVPEPKSSGVYRPPGARLGPTKRGPTQGPPEIFSDTQFPSLQATAKHVETKKDREMEKTFEVVKHKTRPREEGVGKGAPHQLQLDNQYAILGDK
ncbi:protein CDV3 homolog [Erpetoichthys calabaricus]|uniref:Carnitine deficiency-associated gene expressed in ventricle 3 n=1 Tax=Erpetoichthys calabaricus TaxID=27687 RepID=A0A8C4RR05_ERPCA|nr:protein CDV3 homolog [Erpetoichthys calabaricus]